MPDSTDGTIIENAYTGDGDDILTGNRYNNRLFGGRGNDLITGGLGADILDGGAGHDIASYIDSAQAIRINLVTSENFCGDAAGDLLTDIVYGMEIVLE